MEDDWPHYKKIKGVVFSCDSKDYFRFDLSHRITALLRGVNEIKYVWEHISMTNIASHNPTPEVIPFIVQDVGSLWGIRKSLTTPCARGLLPLCARDTQEPPELPVRTGSLNPVRTGYLDPY